MKLLKLYGSAQRGGPDAAACGELLEAAAAARDDDVARILALGDTADQKPGSQLGRHVLQRMHGEIRSPFENRLLDLL